MNENEELEILDLEAELSALRPVAVDGALVARIDRELASASASASGIGSLAASADSSRSLVQGFFARYGQLAAAAVLVLSSGLLFLVTMNGGDRQVGAGTALRSAPENGSATLVSGDGFQRIGNRSSVTAPTEGEVIIEEGRPYRVLKYDFEEEQEWTNPSDGTEVKVKRPRKEQMLIPMRVF